MGIMSGLMPMLGNPAYRKLFEHTLSYFPRSVLLLSSALAFWNASCNVFLATQRSQMKLNADDEENDGYEKEMEAYGNNKMGVQNSSNSSL